MKSRIHTFRVLILTLWGSSSLSSSLVSRTFLFLYELESRLSTLYLPQFMSESGRRLPPGFKLPFLDGFTWSIAHIEDILSYTLVSVMCRWNHVSSSICGLLDLDWLHYCSGLVNSNIKQVHINIWWHRFRGALGWFPGRFCKPQSIHSY